MKQVLLDTNIILDIALQRSPFVTDALKLFSLIDEGKVKGFITANSITDIYYIAKREKGHAISAEFIRDLIQIVDVLGVDRSVIEMALISDLKDFEDAIQEVCAQHIDIIIVTRNKSDFVNSKADVLDEGEVASRLSKD